MSQTPAAAVDDPDFCISLPDESATIALAEDLAACLAPGDLVCLSGDLGAGKSTLARALLRAVADDADLEVPSPTFTLVQTYELPRLTVSHFDLYRVEEPEELQELGLDEMLETGVALVEWPEMGEGELPTCRLWISLTGAEDDAREARLKGQGGFDLSGLSRSLEIRAFLRANGFGQATRRFLKGDASARAYERIDLDGESHVLMNSPALYVVGEQADENSYAQIVHLARDVRPFVAVGEELRRQGFCAPQIRAMDLERGLLLLEHLGTDGVLDADGKVLPERYRAATELLAHLHGRSFPDTVTLPDGSAYSLPVFSRPALLAEVCLFLDWYVPFVSGAEASEDLRAEFVGLWGDVLDRVSGAETGWTLRDYHSPNLLWRGNRSGDDRLGLIDYQDAVIGATAYDLGSLLFDARVEVPADLERELLDTYLVIRAEQAADFDAQAFRSAYAVYAAQRITKILGIFVRLARRDGKPVYLNHLPRMNAYLDRALADPVLSELKRWFEIHRPATGADV